MTRRTLPLVLALLLTAGTAAAVRPGNPGDRMTDRQRQALDAYGMAVEIELDRSDVPAWLMGRLSDRIGADAVSAAVEALVRHGDAFRRGADDDFTFGVVETDQVGQTHVRMHQLYRGLPVVGGQLIVHMTRDAVVGINGRFLADLDLDTTVALSPAQLSAAAEAWTADNGGLAVSLVEVGETVVYAGDLEAEPRTAVRVRLAYHDSEGVQVDDVYVDANAGVALGKVPRVYRAKNRKIYNMNQACISTGNEMPGTLMFSEGGSSTDTAAMGAYNGTGTTYDYYKTRFNRDSYDNAGAAIVSSVHGQFSTGYSCDKNNAAWFDSPYNQMVFGDGDGTTFLNLATSLDVTAHELTHAVTSRSADLVYEKESGALNEAVSDILGEGTAFYAGKGDWKIGAEIYTPSTSGDALRYFANPTADGYSKDYYPERLYSGTCTPSSSNDQCGVHGNSGIANLQFYLLSQGGTHPRGKTTVSVPAIGIAKAEQIWYRALTSYMTSTTTFQGARTATASAASALYGGTCTAEWTAVHKAWDAVGVPGTWSCGTTYSISGSAGTASATVTAGSGSATSDASGNYSIAGLAAGTYTVTPSKSGCTFSPASQSVTITTANRTGINFTATCSTGDTQLTSGVALTGQSVAKSAWKYYYITVPSGATNLTFATTSATADVDIYTQSGAKPTSSSYICRPYSSSGNETCSATNPAAGTWWLGVYGYAAGSYTVTATVTTSTPTYSISGSAGTSGATVTAGGKTATSDASNNYTITGLANGTYTVTPTKTGCTFSPASQSVTVSGANVTGKNFTATCGTGTTLFTDGFEGTGWYVVDTSGTAGSWTIATSSTYPTASPHGGTKFAKFNSYTASSGSQTRIYRNAGFAVSSSYASVTLKFWMYHDTGYSTYADKVQVQVSTNGSTWTNVGAAVNRYTGSTGWAQHTIDLSAYKGQTVYLGFLGISAYGNNEYLDDVTVTAP